MDSEKQGQGSNCLLFTTQIAHWLEAFARRDTIIIDTIQIALIGIQESLSAIISSQHFVNTINSFRHMVQTFIKARHPFILDLLKRSSNCRRLSSLAIVDFNAGKENLLYITSLFWVFINCYFRDFKFSIFSTFEIFMTNFSSKFKFKICQKIKISQPKVISCPILGDFCLANFKFKIQ
jgi:hypothetical protein